MGQLICRLDRLGMTSLHRVGLAGLYMTLDAFDHDDRTKAELTTSGLTWTLSERRVSLDFSDGNEAAALEKLLELAFQIDGGFFKLPGLERGALPTLEQRWLLYQALLGTFLQFGPHRPTQKKGALAIEVDGKQMRIPEFGPIIRYRHQQAAKDFLTSKGRLAADVEIAGWLYPGGAQRHVGWKDSSLREPSELAFCLLFAPVGAIFFLISSRARGRKARTALVLPQFKSLRGYAKLRRYVADGGVQRLTAASPTDAALRFATLAQAADLADELGANIRVLTFGIVDWNEKQKSRTGAVSVSPLQLPGLHNYELASAIFENRWQRVKPKTDRRGNITIPEHYFVRPFTAREIIADNVANRRPWFSGFADYMASAATRVPLQFERKELFAMTQEAEYEHPRERVFIEACHEAWRRRLGQLGERSRREGIAFNRLASGDYEKLRASLSRCKNAPTLRAVLTDFWARGGSLPSLRDGWMEILPLLDDAQWRKARDLALLGLASYQPATPAEEQALTETQSDEGSEP